MPPGGWVHGRDGPLRRPWAEVRVGEARRPGPWRICAANVTSLPSNEGLLARIKADLIGVTETRLGELQQRAYSKRLANRGLTAVWGKPQPLRKRKGKRLTYWSVAHGGVGLVVREGIPVRAAPRDSPRQQELWRTGRWLHALVGTGRGREVVNVIVYYGIPGAVGSPEAMAENERLLTLVLEEAALLAGAPTILLGDFNVPPDRSGILSAALASRDWVDLHQAWAALRGVSPAPTCFVKKTSKGSRIDLILANREAASAATGAWVDEETVLPTHRPVFADLEWEAFTGRCWRDKQPKAFSRPEEDEGEAPLTPAQRSALWAAREAAALECKKEFAGEWAAALRSGSAERIWHVWNRWAEKSFLRWKGLHTLPHKERRRYLGRGAVRAPQGRRAAAPTARETHGEAGTEWQLRLLRQLRRLEDVAKQLDSHVVRGGVGAAPQEVRVRWKKIRRCGADLFPGADWVLPEEPPASPAQVWEWHAKLKRRCDQVAAKQGKERVARWRAKLLDSWGSTRREVFQWVGEGTAPPPLMAQRTDGSWTGAAEEVDEEMRRAWLPIFARYAASGPPDFDAFKARFGPYVKKRPMRLERLTVAQLRATLARMKGSSAGGRDGWRVRELKELPDALLEGLLEVFEVAEMGGVWPAALQEAVVSLIPKGEGGAPLAQRPVTVLSGVYRLWAATRAGEMLEWQEEWISAAQRGFRRGHSCLHLYWEAGLAVEDALLRGEEDLCGVLFDYAKCFDRVPQQLLFWVAEETGLHERLLRGMRSVYDGMRRRFKTGQGLGADWAATNGILQGCPLSVVALNLLVALWANAVAEEAPEAVARAFADDTGARAKGDRAPEVIGRVIRITEEYAELSDQELNGKKTVGFAVGSRHKKAMAALEVSGEPLRLAGDSRDLGAHLSYHRAPRPGAVKARAEDATAAADRCGLAPLPFDGRAELTAAKTGQKAVYGCEVTRLNKTLRRKYRTAAMRAIWGEKRKRRSPALVLTLLAPGHRLDPGQTVPWQSLSAVREMILREGRAPEELNRAWAAYDAGDKRVPGPIGIAWDEVQKMGWRWASPEVLERPAGPALDMRTTPKGYWQHALREGARGARWREAVAKRPDLDGIQGGVDREATCHLYRQGHLPERRRGLLRGILGGGLWTGASRARAGLAETAACPHCGAAREDLYHRWWECPAWEEVRAGHEISREDRAQWPRSLLTHGIVPADGRVLQEEQKLALENDPTDEFLLPPAGRGPRPRRVAWTDGASRFNQDPRLRRAGWGVFWGEGDPENVGRPLAGLQQTNQRAELRAALRAVCRGADEVRTDSEYVVKGAARIARGQTGTPKRDGANRDLWEQMADALARRGGAGAVAFTKVLGHAKEVDVAEGRTTRRNKWGNDRADKLAVDGALQHAAPSALIEDLKRNKARAQQVQLMMVDISDAALAREGQCAGGGPPPPPPGGAGRPGGRVDEPEEPSYPWGWSPEGEREQVEMPAMAPPSRWHGATFIWGPRLWELLRKYVASLQWPPEDARGGEAGVSYLELALDFEVAMGCELPFPKPGATGPASFVFAGDPGVDGRSPASAAERARLFGDAWRCLERRVQRQLHPGRKDKHTKGLRPLGHWPPLSGFSRRPVLLGGEATERALQGLLGLKGRGSAPGGNPRALHRRPMYRAGRAAARPNGEAQHTSPEPGQDGDREETAAAAAAAPDPAPGGGGTGPGDTDTSKREPTGKGAGEDRREEPAGPPPHLGQPAEGKEKPSKRKPPAIIRMTKAERGAVYADAAPGDGKHSLERVDGEWRCKVCRRPGFRNPKALLATVCFGRGKTAKEVQSLQKKEAARARHLREAEAARQHNAKVAAGGPGVRKHVLVPGGDTHTCEECGLQLPTMLRARNLERRCRGQDPDSDSDNDVPPAERHVLRRVKGKDAGYECAVCHRRDSKRRLSRTRCRGPGAKTKSELLTLANAERAVHKREREREDNRKHNAAVLAAGKGELRHVAVSKGEVEVCEVCGRQVAASHNNRSRFMAGVCPGAPKPLTPEEAAHRDKIRGYKEAYKQRRLEAERKAQEAEAPPQPKKLKGAAAATTAAGKPSTQNEVPPQPPPQPPPRKKRKFKGTGKSWEENSTPGGTGGALADLRCRLEPGLRRAGGEHLRQAPGNKRKGEEPASEVKKGRRTGPPPPPPPPPPPKLNSTAVAQKRKPQPKRRGRAAPAAPE